MGYDYFELSYLFQQYWQVFWKLNIWMGERKERRGKGDKNKLIVYPSHPSTFSPPPNSLCSGHPLWWHCKKNSIKRPKNISNNSFIWNGDFTAESWTLYIAHPNLWWNLKFKVLMMLHKLYNKKQVIISGTCTDHLKNCCIAKI